MENESETFPIYIAILFLILLITIITIIQNSRINNLRKEIETIKVTDAISNTPIIH